MFTITEIAQATEGKLIHGEDRLSVSSVSIDSRQVAKGELFVAVKGDIFDGHDFIADVVARGVRVLVVHKPIKISDPKVSVIMVKNTTLALGDLARFHRLRFKIPVIALTGSAGKTTTKEMIAVVLSKKYRVLKNEGTQNNHIGVPLTLLKLKPTHQVVVLECGTNQPGDIPWLADVARPDVAVFTNIGESHLEKLKTPKGVLKEKWTLTNWMKKQGTVIINTDDAFLGPQAKTCKNVRVISYGMKNLCRIQAKNVRVEMGHHLVFSINGNQQGGSSTRETTFELNTCGINNMYNALAAYACGDLLAVPVKDMIVALKNFEFPKGRGQILKLGKGWLINDSYNANPVSMRSAIQTLKELESLGKKILVVADMLELGTKTKELHAQVGRVIAQSGIDVLITVGALSRHLAAQARAHNKNMKVFACADIDSAQKNLAKILANGDAVLVKGSRRMAMERVVEFLLKSPG
ncbi:MAG: UDP-N-acetylmuramoyl-tripeptide--D-alanyl-D-alanine ligase [Candidatus Omnitrophica bacterium]|nr:UDP-N-acetylmuramoyl-tripeptide--D-alanyl-D-alanine ligase [Candidatus Omnitrophota bacterium]